MTRRLTSASVLHLMLVRGECVGGEDRGCVRCEGGGTYVHREEEEGGE